jgi:hypothetical protein
VDLLADGAAWLGAQLKGFASVTVTYSRGLTQSVTLQATPADTLLRLTDEAGGALVVRTDRDFLFPAADLVFGGQVTTPRIGDLIREPVGSTVHLYEVRHPAGEAVWRYEDNSRAIVRVHCVYVGMG